MSAAMCCFQYAKRCKSGRIGKLELDEKPLSPQWRASVSIGDTYYQAQSDLRMVAEEFKAQLHSNEQLTNLPVQ